MPVTVGPPDGSGVTELSPGSVKAGSTNTLVFTYTGPNDSLLQADLSITVPPGWLAPSASSVSTFNRHRLCFRLHHHCDRAQPGGRGQHDRELPGDGTAHCGPGRVCRLGAVQPGRQAGPPGRLAGGDSDSRRPGRRGREHQVVASVGAGRLGQPFVFTYTGPRFALSQATLSIAVPPGWPASGAGSVAASTGTASVSGSTITVTGLNLAAGASMTVSYQGTAPPTAGQGVFAVSEQSSPAGKLAPLAVSPVETVTAVALADGIGTMSASPSEVEGKTATTLNFIYKGPPTAITDAEVGITMPPGWTAPSTNEGHAGFTTASTGTVSASGRTIYVSRLDLGPSETMTVTYGEGGGADAVRIPGAPGRARFVTAERSSPTGVLVELPKQPIVQVQVPATLTVSPVPNEGPPGTRFALQLTASVPCRDNGYLFRDEIAPPRSASGE